MQADKSVYRILDANANRAREGLRVVEEHFRMALDDAETSRRLKDLRHAVTGAISSMGIDGELIASRRSDTDVGATPPVGTEGTRTDFAHLVTANLRRSQEALRVLEEYSKLVSDKVPAEFKRLRFETYTLEKTLRLRDGGDCRNGSGEAH